MKTFLIIVCVIGFFGSLANGIWQNCLCYLMVAVFFGLCLPDKKTNKTNKKNK